MECFVCFIYILSVVVFFIFCLCYGENNSEHKYQNKRRSTKRDNKLTEIIRNNVLLKICISFNERINVCKKKQKLKCWKLK